MIKATMENTTRSFRAEYAIGYKYYSNGVI